MSKKYSFMKFIFGFILLSLIIANIGFEKVYITVKSFNAIYLIPVLVIYILNFYAGAVNLSVLISKLNNKIKLSKLLRYNVLSWSFGMFVPGRLGEFSLIYYLEKEGIIYGEGLAISMLDKIISFVIFSVISLIGCFIFFDIQTALKIFFVLSSILIVLLFLITSYKVRLFIRKSILRGYEGKLANFYKTFKEYFLKYKIALMINGVVTFIKLVLMSIVLMLLFKGFNIEVGIITVLVITSMVTILSLIPISISGLGIREITYVYMFNMMNIPSNISLSVSLITLVINYTMGLSILTFFKIK